MLGREPNITTNKECMLIKNGIVIEYFTSIKDAVDYYRFNLNGEGYSTLRKDLKYENYKIELISNDYRKTI